MAATQPPATTEETCASRLTVMTPPDSVRSHRHARHLTCALSRVATPQTASASRALSAQRTTPSASLFLALKIARANRSAPPCPHPAMMATPVQRTFAPAATAHWSAQTLLAVTTATLAR